MSDQPSSCTTQSDADLRLECARLASVFSEPGSVMENAERMYLWIKNERSGDGNRTISQP